MNVPLQNCIWGVSEPKSSIVRHHTASVPLDGNINVGNIVQNEVRKTFVALLSDKADERLCGQLLAKLVRSQPVLSEEVIELIDPCHTFMVHSCYREGRSSEVYCGDDTSE